MPAVKCYYEVLGVARDASDDDIKKGYRKQALVWHPDKNPDRIAEATEQFRAIQQAYDVLSDPQERTWYDDHREAIIRGGFKHRGAEGSPTVDDDSLDVYEYFTTSCFSGFGDDENGFFAVYSKVFKQLSDEDFPFLDERITYPSFGTSESNYADVTGPFYDFWESYVTAKSYCWMDKWDTRDAPNRDVRRLMEAENKKLREKSRKERNEEVRALVGFVKKRDPRMVARKKEIEERNVAIAKKQADQRRQEALARREMRAAVAREATEGKTDWTHTNDEQLRDLEEKLTNEFGGHSISEDVESGNMADDNEDPLYCVACDKSFKTEKALVNHVRSRKHIERVEFVRGQLGESADNEDDEMASQILKRLDFLEAKAAADGDCDDDTDSPSKFNKKKSGSKKKKGTQQNNESADEQTNTNEGDDEIKEPSASGPVPEPTEPHKKLNGKASKKKKGKQLSDSEDDGPLNDSDQQADQVNAQPVPLPVYEPDEPQKKPKVKTRGPKIEPEPEEVIWKCDKCKEVFPTRNKLFQHLSDSGHALPPKAAGAPASAKGGGKTDKKKAGKIK